MIEIDGSDGEGGGQVLRTALALSMCTQKPFRINRIRGKRPKPGLMRQHLTAVLAAKSICGAKAHGAEIGSDSLEFVPGPVIPGTYRFAVGTAGSATLVLQTILPALFSAGQESFLTLEGGTHNAWAPPFHFIRDAFLPVLARMGANVAVQLEAWGFFPAGGGRFTTAIVPAPGGLRPIELVTRGSLQRAEVTTVVSRVPFEVAEDECRMIAHLSRFPLTHTAAETVNAAGPGNVAMVSLAFEQSAAFFTAFGERGVSRKEVGRKVSDEANAFFASEAAVDRHLADQILLPMALAGGGMFTTLAPTMHTKTNAQIIRLFLDVDIAMGEIGGKVWKITVAGKEHEHGMDKG
jgi:RNA 3'-terminal phosphate cyclase (ATP)